MTTHSSSPDDLHRDNLHSWEALAPIHARGSGSAFYRIEEFVAGECKLGPWEVEELGPVDGRSLLHLQCHIGTDTFSWARRGARVTGLHPFSKAPVSETSEGTYADRSAQTGPLTCHCWDHGFGEILNALTTAGFEFIHLHERDEAFCEPFPGVFEPSRTNYWKLKPEFPRIPLSYTLKMRRCGASHT